MSDFLSNFSGDNYKKKKEEKEAEALKEYNKKEGIEESISKEEISKAIEEKEKSEISKEDVASERKHRVEISKDENKDEKIPGSENKKDEDHKKENIEYTSKVVIQKPTTSLVKHFNEEETETDPTYKNKKRKKFLIIAVGVVIAVAILSLIYYNFTHVKLPDFSGKSLTEVRTWTSENKIKLQVEQEYNFDIEVNQVIEQETQGGKKIKKGSTLVVLSSLGADPEEVLKLPNFSELSLSEAKKWIEENKAENLSIIEEYSDDIEEGVNTRFEFKKKEVTKENYRRRDKAIAYYSKGKEVFEKNIIMPDFTGKTKVEVEEWAKVNEIQLTFEEADSDEIPVEGIISQSVGKDEKIAKRDSLTVVVSIGKAIVVPNFSNYSSEEAATAVEGLMVVVKNQFSANVPYGRLISQSVAEGTKVTEKDNTTIQVVYSVGQPYLKDVGESTLEGDLQRIFYEEYQSKGANIKYVVKYVDSYKTKGSVVAMSAFNQFVAMDYTVTISISKGNLAPPADEIIEEGKPE